MAAGDPPQTYAYSFFNAHNDVAPPAGRQPEQHELPPPPHAAKIDLGQFHSAKTGPSQVHSFFSSPPHSAKLDLGQLPSASIDLGQVLSANINASQLQSAKTDPGQLQSAKTDPGQLQSAKTDPGQLQSAKKADVSHPHRFFTPTSSPYVPPMRGSYFRKAGLHQEEEEEDACQVAGLLPFGEYSTGQFVFLASDEAEGFRAFAGLRQPRDQPLNAAFRHMAGAAETSDTCLEELRSSAGKDGALWLRQPRAAIFPVNVLTLAPHVTKELLGLPPAPAEQMALQPTSQSAQAKEVRRAQWVYLSSIFTPEPKICPPAELPRPAGPLRWHPEMVAVRDDPAFASWSGSPAAPADVGFGPLVRVSPPQAAQPPPRAGGDGGRPRAAAAGGAPSGARVHECVLRKGPSEAMGVTWQPHTLVVVAVASAAARAGLRGFVGRQLTHIDGTRVRTVPEIRLAAQGRTEMTLRFAGPQPPSGEEEQQLPMHNDPPPLLQDPTLGPALGRRPVVEAPEAPPLLIEAQEEPPVLAEAQTQTEPESPRSAFGFPYQDADEAPFARNLRISHLPSSWGDAELHEMCAVFGPLRRHTVWLNLETKESRGYGLVEYETVHAANAAKKELSSRGWRVQWLPRKGDGRRRGRGTRKKKVDQQQVDQQAGQAPAEVQAATVGSDGALLGLDLLTPTMHSVANGMLPPSQHHARGME